MTKDIQGHVSFFPLTTAIAGFPAAGVTATPIATTSSTSYAIAQPRSVQDLGRKTGDAAGPFNIMEALEQPAGAKRTRIVVVGTGGIPQGRALKPRNNIADAVNNHGMFSVIGPTRSGRPLPL